MIAAIMLYCLAIATLVGCSAWALEQAAIRFGLARRFVWLVALLASCIVPTVMIANATDQAFVAQPARIISMPQLRDAPPTTPSLTLTQSWPDRPDWDGWFIGLWIVTSAGMLTLWTLASIRTHRVMETADLTSIGDRL